MHKHRLWGALVKQNEKLLMLNDGRKICFSEYGDPDGVPIMYFHGTPGSRLEAGRFHGFASANQYRLIGIDRPGMGLSSPNKKHSILSWAKDVEFFADSLKLEKFSVVGHSGGAPFVAACAYVIPERLSGAAIVSGIAPFENPAAMASMDFKQRIIPSLIKTIPWFTPLMMKLTSMMMKNPKMLSQMVKQLPEVDQQYFRDPESCKAMINCALEAFRNGVAGPAHEMRIIFNSWGFNLEDIKLPISIWHGALDAQGPVSHAKIYASLIPNATLKIFDNEGHHSLIMNQIEHILKEVSLSETLAPNDDKGFRV